MSKLHFSRLDYSGKVLFKSSFVICACMFSGLGDVVCTAVTEGRVCLGIAPEKLQKGAAEVPFMDSGRPTDTGAGIWLCAASWPEACIAISRDESGCSRIKKAVQVRSTISHFKRVICGNPARTSQRQHVCPENPQKKYLEAL